MPEANQNEGNQNEGIRLIFNDGTVIEDGSCGYSEGRLWCWVTGYTMPQAAQVFFDPAKTEQIMFQYGGMEQVYHGFTNCVNLFIDYDGKISACMKRGDVNV
jgi:hypothetical protein